MSQINISVMDLVLPVLFVFSLTASAAINGSDNFNNDIVNPSYWGSDVTYGDGMLTETSQQLQYACAIPLTGDEDYSYHPWILNQATYDTDWEVILDVQNTVAPNIVGQVATAGIQVFTAGNLNNAVYVELYSSALGLLPLRRGFDSAVSTNDTQNVYLGVSDSFNLGVTSGAIRMVYNSQSNVFTAFYDANGSSQGGYTWTQLGSFGINNSGGATANTSWGMSGSQAFLVAIYGFDNNIAVTNGQLNLDNFSAATASVQPPILVNHRSGSSIVLSWPQSAFKYSLQQSASLIPASWTTVTQALTLSNGVYSASIPISGTASFFRLKQ